MTPEEQVQEPLTLSFAPYTGAWTSAEAAHLLRRTLFGPTFNKIRDAVTNGMDATVTQLMLPPTLTVPLAHSADEIIAATGTTWITSVYPTNQVDLQKTENARRESLSAWGMERINTEQVSVFEKMCLFWQNHYAAEATFDSRATYDYLNLIRTHALGNFRQFVKEMTINPSMLVFLNGAANNKFSPNENFARELLELYSIGKGEQVALGDYTNYTELDISESSKILTGWTVTGFVSDTVTQVTSVFEPILHDTTTKTLSARFGGVSIPNADAAEYENYIDIIFQQPETAKHICRKLYRWFVNHDITTDVETTIITEMANLLTSSNFEIQPVVEALLKSEHFYDISMRGSIIKNPLECIFSMYNATEAVPNFDLTTNYKMYLGIFWLSGTLGLSYLQPPNVGGWSAYYQAPNFYKNWINSSYVKLRFDLGSYVTLYGGIDVDGNKFPIDLLNFVNNLSVPSDSAQIIEDIVTVFCPKGLLAAQKTTLEVLLLGGLPAFEWTIQYNEYLADPTNVALSEALKQRVALVLDQVFKLPEFQTI